MFSFYPTLSRYADDLVKFFQQICSPEQSMALAKALEFIKRSRKMVPGLFNRAVINTMAVDKE